MTIRLSAAIVAIALTMISRSIVEDLPALGDQRLVGVIDVPLVGQLVEDVEDPRLRPELRILGEAQLLGDLVGGDEADPEDVRRQAVGVLPDDVDRLVPVLLEDPGGIARADAVGLQEDHDRADLLLLLPRLLDHGDPLRADPVDLGELLDVALDDVRGSPP